MSYFLDKDKLTDFMKYNPNFFNNEESNLLNIEGNLFYNSDPFNIHNVFEINPISLKSTEEDGIDDNIENKLKNENIENKNSQEYSYISTFEKKNSQNSFTQKKKRKSKESKFYDHISLIRKSLNEILKNLLNFSNKSISNFYGQKNNNEILAKQLKKIEKKKLNYNEPEAFLNKSLKDIFSLDISPKYKNYKPNFNKNLIESLIEDESKTKSQYFRNFFNLKFIDCLSHFKGEKIVKELKDLSLFENIKQEYKDDENYFGSLRDYIVHFDEIIKIKENKKEK